MSEGNVFNTSLEAGVRSISFLDAYYPKSLDFEELMKIDYVLVNSADFNGPNSLHPGTPNRLGELSSRRKIVYDGIELMMRFGFIEIEMTNDGVYYRATENAEPYLELMKASYSIEIRRISSWLGTELNEFGFDNINKILGKRFF